MTDRSLLQSTAFSDSFSLSLWKKRRRFSRRLRSMKPLTLPQAAAFLQFHPNWVRKEAKAGRIPGRKIGREWRFLEEDLVVFIRSGYSESRQAPLVEVSSCQSSKGAAFGGSISRHRAESALDARLKRKSGNKHRNSTTD
ncbi:MAG: helix-turn-helix domain-containing protein [Leptospirillia bacterium]